MARIAVGPVIGKVTDNTARILLELDQDARVTCIATPREGKKKTPVRNTQAFKENRPGVFRLTKLAPETRYDLQFQVDKKTLSRPGSFQTFPRVPERMNLAAVSCNFTTKRGETNLWEDLHKRYVEPGDIDMVLHLGDQVYGDSMFAWARNLLDGKKYPSRTDEEKILKYYRQLYRWTWNDPATRDVLAQVPNLMIWDDHEIRDDWGSREADKKPTSPEYHIGRLARRVFREYQRQLWDDFDTDQDAACGTEQHAHRWGPIGILFLDVRGGRSFQTDTARPYLSTQQWNDIENLFAKKGVLGESSVRAVVVISSVPLAFLSGHIANLGDDISHFNDLMDHWSYGPHRKEQIEMIRLLRYWKEKGKGDRELLLLGGDVHVGGHTDIRRRSNGKESVIFKQLTTSPITNTPPKSVEFYGLRLLMEAIQGLGEHYSFEHYDYTNRRNYGVILIRIPNKGTPNIQAGLEKGVPTSKR